jgi:outer membrane murein-binding lipoprotein Lpp
VKYAAAALLGALLVTLVLLISAEREIDKLKSQLTTINAQSEKLEHEIKQHNEQLQKQHDERKREIELADEKHANDISNARANFIAERLRLQADSESCREESASLSRANSNHARSAAETERLLLRTLDEAEAVNAAYASCVMLIQKVGD